MDPEISIILTSHNNVVEKNNSLNYVLKSLRNQTGTQPEVVLVDNNCTDTTIDSAIKAYPAIKVIDGEYCGKNIGALRNLGAKHTNGRILLFLDDDTILVDPRCVQRMLEYISDYDFLCGAKRYWSSPYWFKHVNIKQSTTSFLHTLKDISFLPRGINKNIGFRDLNEFTFIGNFGVLRKDVFLETGGFNENFSGWGLEDTEYMMRLAWKNYKYRILFNDDISVIHLTHPSNDKDDYLENLKLFFEIERKFGYSFHVNHFFGIYEADGSSIFSEIK